ncbi:hypothetical protein PHAVU_L008143 [Phaseolus vulgaris]|uniref:Uncharacterized protein n=2 Tax=Phaseolus vulgaris TaxID=3885 RepID=V7BWN2_PHAVU|nr:hypothetical protein PHAVU_005G146600g [Phaseolus vulgaris]ESW22349.1 hypothetical protein PHAVU_005G146600g [Phaseolus vulgaris]
MEMEYKASLMKRRRGGGCTTRLQMHAPASLDIDKVLCDRPSNPFGEVSKAIPLLSPLTFSHQPIYEDITIHERTSQNIENSNGSGMNEDRTPSTGWEHPAMASFPQASSSSFCSFFQKKCVCVNRA